jgi:hypothetical protein
MIMKRREFLRLFIFGAFLALFGKKVKAGKNRGENLKEAMFWRRLDDE